MTSLINAEGLENSIKKIRLYKNSLNLKYEDIIKSLSNLNSEYKTDNTTYFNDIKIDFKNKSKVINCIHNNNIYILEKVIVDYKNVTKLVEKKFNDII